MSTENDFWRLLSDYERLTQDETTALKEFNFPAIQDIQGKKQIFFPELVKVGEQCGLDGRNQNVAARLTLLSEAGQRNAAFVSSFMEKRRGELDELNLVSGRVRSLRSAYSCGRQETGDNLFAEG